jgi:hypothetical protein
LFDFENEALPKRQRMFLKWEDYTDIKSPAKVPRPELRENKAFPDFVTPKGWLDRLCQDVTTEFNLQETENPRVSPVALVRCSCGAKTRALHELAWALGADNSMDSIIYISFNGLTLLMDWEKILWKLFCEEFYLQLLERQTPGASGTLMSLLCSYKT